jgi:hypothetical protein
MRIDEVEKDILSEETDEEFYSFLKQQMEAESFAKSAVDRAEKRAREYEQTKTIK